MAALGPRLSLNSDGTLANFDEVIRISDVAPNFSAMVVGLGEELRALAAPLHVARLHELSADFYARVLDGKIVRHGQPTILQVANSWIILNVGGGPPDDKPTVTLLHQQALTKQPATAGTSAASAMSCWSMVFRGRGSQ